MDSVSLLVPPLMLRRSSVHRTTMYPVLRRCGGTIHCPFDSKSSFSILEPAVFSRLFFYPSTHTLALPQLNSMTCRVPTQNPFSTRPVLPSPCPSLMVTIFGGVFFSAPFLRVAHTSSHYSLSSCSLPFRPPSFFASPRFPVSRTSPVLPLVPSPSARDLFPCCRFSLWSLFIVLPFFAGFHYFCESELLSIFFLVFLFGPPPSVLLGLSTKGRSLLRPLSPFLICLILPWTQFILSHPVGLIPAPDFFGMLADRVSLCLAPLYDLLCSSCGCLPVLASIPASSSHLHVSRLQSLQSLRHCLCLGVPCSAYLCSDCPALIVFTHARHVLDVSVLFVHLVSECCPCVDEQSVPFYERSLKPSLPRSRLLLGFFSHSVDSLS